MPINALLARGFNPGAGAVSGARNAYAMDREKQVRTRNAFVQDRAFDANQEHRNATLTQGDQRIAQQHAASVRQAVMNAQSPEQAEYLWNEGQQEAIQQGYLDPNEAKPFNPGMFAATPSASQVAIEKEGRANTEHDRRYARERADEVSDAKTERARPKTPTEQAKERKAIAQADIAEVKLDEALDAAKAGKSTADELVGLARALLTPEGGLTSGAAAVFGPAQGALPSVWGSTISAEAKIDRLVSLLTLENMDKMKGVLSDNDMKVLTDASTILNNKRIPDSEALAEIQRLAGGLEFAPPENAASGTIQRDAEGNVTSTPDVDAMVAKYAD